MNESMENALEYGLRQAAQEKALQKLKWAPTAKYKLMRDAHVFSAHWFSDAADNAWQCCNY